MLAKTALFAFSLAGALCASQPGKAASAAPVVASPAAAAPAEKASVEKPIETGIATWYGSRHSHHYTASGERFQPWKLTAAHRSIPLGTIVRVTDLDTGRSVVVRVNDREPPHGERCIDLSEGAARALGIHSTGIADVSITALNRTEAVEVAEAPDDEPAPPPIPHHPHHRRARR
jgi:rare lipoprotein A